jgi:hypothetical protein
VTVFALENINPNPKLSNLFVYAPTGELISQGNAQVSLQDPKQMSITIKPKMTTAWRRPHREEEYSCAYAPFSGAY